MEVITEFTTLQVGNKIYAPRLKKIIFWLIIIIVIYTGKC